YPTLFRSQSANIASAIAMINGIRQARQVDALPQELRLDPAPWHAMDVDTALRRLESSLEGLSWEQARQRLSEPVSEPSALLHFLNAVTAELGGPLVPVLLAGAGDRKSTRLNSSHVKNSYAVFCLKKKID